MYPIVFAFISLAAAADSRSHREARISASFTAITLSLIVFWISYSSGQASEKNENVIPFLFVFPVLVTLSAIYALATNRQIGMPAKLADFFKNGFSSPQAALAGVRTKLLNPRSGRGARDE